MPEARKKIIGCTEPSFFTADVLRTIEKFFGANPFKLSQDNEEDLHYWLNQCDGVIISGGVDLHPRTYGCPILNDYNFSKFDVARDIREERIIRYCFSKDIPILGICRGHQMLGAHHGAKFIPDLSDSLICHQPNSQKISHAREEPMHWVKLIGSAQKEYCASDDLHSELFGGKNKDKCYLFVNSFHHQGLLYDEKHPIQDVKVLGVSHGVEKEQIVELMTGTKNRFISAQWHPEYDWESQASSKMVLSKFQEMIESPKEPNRLLQSIIQR